MHKLKLISGFLIVLIILNFMFCNGAYADPTGDQIKSPYLNGTKKSNTLDAEIIEQGTVSRSQGSSSKTELSSTATGNSAIGMIAGILARIVNVLIALQVDLLMGLLTHGREEGISSSATSTASDEIFWFSIDRAIFNRIALFESNYLDIDETSPYTVGSGEYEISISKNEGNLKIKESITRVYYVCRIIALILSLLVLIYIGIRMAISTVASDQARYKKMLISWVESIVVLFVMIYIISAILIISNKLVDIFFNLRCELLKDGEEIFEDTVRSEAWAGLFTRSGFDLAIWSIIYWCLLILEVKFFVTYARRFLMIGLLITVSPLIIITYSMDKAGDGKAQVFSHWIQEFLIAVLIQPLHALIYLVFVFTANSIAARSPLVSLALLLSLTMVERMVKQVFNMKGIIIKDMHFLKRGGK